MITAEHVIFSPQCQWPDAVLHKVAIHVIGKQKCSENGKCTAVKMGTGIQ
jgi:hypothetical protein